jgi:hypothetical protein
VYYKDGIGEEEAKKTAELFNQALSDANAESSSRKSFQLTKVNDTVQLKMVANKEKLAKLDGDATLYAILYLVSDSVFNGAPVNLVMTDKKFEGFKTLSYIKKTPLSDYGTRYSAGNVEVFGKDFSPESSQELADLLNKELQPASMISFQISRQDDGFFVVKMVSSADKVGAVSEASIKDISEKISQQVLSGAPLIFHLTDAKFTPLRTYEYQTEGFKTEPEDSIPVSQ